MQLNRGRAMRSSTCPGRVAPPVSAEHESCLKRRKKPGSASARVGAALRMAATWLRRGLSIGVGRVLPAHRATRRPRRRRLCDRAQAHPVPLLPGSSAGASRMSTKGQPSTNSAITKGRVRRLSSTAKQLGYTLVTDGLPADRPDAACTPTCCTNCFSVAKRDRSAPYSLRTTLTVSGPSASIVVRSTPLMR